MVFVVVGGGIFGLFTAYHLVNEGVDVVLIEQGEPGGWSRAAAGLIEYRIFGSNLINAPGYIVKYLRMIRSGDAVIRYINTNWLFKYLGGYGHGIPSDIIETIRLINDNSRSVYRRLAEEGNDFEYSEEPYYKLTSNIEGAIEETKRDPLNPKFEVTEFMGREALAFYDTARLSTDLLVSRLLREVGSRVRIVKSFVWDVGDGEVYLGNGDVLRGDAVIITTGYWASTLGIPVMPFRGFGIRVRASRRIEHMVSFDDLGIFVIPFSGWFKVTSRFDPDCDIDTGPLREIVRRVSSILGNVEIIDVTIGYRPCTPDDLPVIDRISDKTHVATGGCRLG